MLKWITQKWGSVESCALLDYYTASSGKSPPTFRDNLDDSSHLLCGGELEITHTAPPWGSVVVMTVESGRNSKRDNERCPLGLGEEEVKMGLVSCSQTIQWRTELKKKNRQCTYNVILKGSINYCCWGKAVSIACSECVFVALGIQHAIGMRHTAGEKQ